MSPECNITFNPFIVDGETMDTSLSILNRIQFCLLNIDEETPILQSFN